MAVVLMTNSLKLGIRVARRAGGTHLARMVDEMDLPWLLELISELRIEPSAVVTLTDSALGDELVIRIRQDNYDVEWFTADTRFRLALNGQADGCGKIQPSVGLAAARSALHSVIGGRPLDEGVRWVRPDG